MGGVRQLVFRIIKITAIIAIVLIAIIYFLFDNPMPIITGVVFGSCFGILNFYDLSLTLIKASTMNPGKANGYTTMKYLVRYVFMGIVLLISIKADYIHVIGILSGLLLIKFVIISTNLFNDKKFFVNILRRKEEK